MSQDAPKLLNPEQLDNLALTVLELARELWVVKDRQIVTESLLRERGLLGDVDGYQPSPELNERLARERQRFLDGIMAGLLSGRAG